jgi:pilus assembly protein CpaE
MTSLLAEDSVIEQRAEKEQSPMRAIIIGEQEAVTGDIRQILLEQGEEYDPIDTASLAMAANAVARDDYRLVIVVLPPQADTALTALYELRGATAAALFVVGPTSDAKFVLRVLRQGADEYLDQADLRAELKAGLAAVKSQPAAAQGDGRIVSVMAASGGTGASTLCANLAVLWATWHSQSGLVDLRRGEADLEVLLDLHPAYRLGELCRSARRLDENMFRQSLARHASGVHLVAAPIEAADRADVTPQGVRRVLGLARSLFSFVAVDLESDLDENQLAAVNESDLILLMLRLDIASLRGARRMLDALWKAGVAEDHVRIVAGRYGQARELPLKKVEQALGFPIPFQIPDAPAEVNAAVNKGVPVVLDRPRARVSKSFIKLATAIQEMYAAHEANGRGGLGGLFRRGAAD